MLLHRPWQIRICISRTVHLLRVLRVGKRIYPKCTLLESDIATVVDNFNSLTDAEMDGVLWIAYEKALEGSELIYKHEEYKEDTSTPTGGY